MAVDINISNYEAFLLSAVDGELTAEESVALELFLQQHPHLMQEQALLNASRLEPDTDVRFEGKQQLYRQASLITTVNYESYLLDYADNELTGAEKLALEQLMEAHPHIRQELVLLQAARLTPDLSLQFPDKRSLYRHSSTRLRPVWWWGAAAAVVAGLAVWLLPSVTENSQPVTPAIVQQQPVKPPVMDSPALTPVEKAPAITHPDKRPLTAERSATAAAPDNRSLASNSNRKQAAPAKNKENEKQPEQVLAHQANNNVATTTALTQLPPPITTSTEVVQEHKEKIAQQNETVTAPVTIPDEAKTVLANAAGINKNAASIPESVNAPAAAKQMQGELIMSATMNGESRLLNGVAGVAKFFSKKRSKK